MISILLTDDLRAKVTGLTKEINRIEADLGNRISSLAPQVYNTCVCVCNIYACYRKLNYVTLLKIRATG